MVEKTINPHSLSVYLQREEADHDLTNSPPQAWHTMHNIMKLTNINRRACSLFQKRLSLHS